MVEPVTEIVPPIVNEPGSSPAAPIYLETGGVDAPGIALSKIGLTTSAQCDRLFAALAEAQGVMSAVPKDNVAKVQTKNGGQVTYYYEDLGSLLEATRKPLSDHGLAVIQIPHVEGREVTVTSMLVHRSGQWVSCVLKLSITDNSLLSFAQSVGSAITYARRYSYGPLVGVAVTHDDDGKAAGPSTPPNRQQAPQTRPYQAKKTEAEKAIEPAKEEPAYMILARILAKKYGGKNVEDYSLLITSAYEDPAMTWDHVKSHPDLSIQVSDTLQRYCETHQVQPGELLARLKESQQQQI